MILLPLIISFIQDERRLMDRLLEFSVETYKNENAAREKTLRDADKRIAFIENAAKKLFEEKIAGNMPDSLFKKLLADYEIEMAMLNEKAATLRQKIQEDRNSKTGVEQWIGLIKECAAIDRLDRATVFQLIDHVTVHEQCDECGKRTQTVEIMYKFVGRVS